MGYLRPTAIIVGGSYDAWAKQAHAKAVEIFSRHGLDQLVGGLIDGVTNHESSFLVAWDGSKEGWEPSDRADLARAEFVAWLRSVAYKDGSSPLDWVELQYGGDDKQVVALAHDGEAFKSDRELRRTAAAISDDIARNEARLARGDSEL